MAGYTRQDTQNNISNGSVIDADDLDAEFNAIEAGFNSSTGHSHDGTAGEGVPITKVGPAQDLIVSAGALTPKTTNTLDLGTNSIQFKNAWFDGTVDTDTLTVSGNATVGGTLGVTGAITATAGITGDLTGDLTGNVTGNVTGTVSDVSNHDTGDIAEGSNLYHTTARARAAISAVGNLSYNSTTGVMSYTQGSTDTVAEGSTNLYHTTARARASISAVGNLSYNSTTGVLSYTQGSTDTVAEGSSNLYFTNERVDDRVAALVVAGTNMAITYNDTAGTLTFNAASAGGYDLSNNDTGDLSEGSNLYFTTARARAAISATGSLSYNSSTGVISFTQGNTDTVAEGTTNLYYTNARARAAMSVVDAGGDGSLSYNSSTGAITYTGPSATEVRAHFSAGTGVTYSSGQFSIGQPVGTSSNVTFGNVTVGGSLTVSGTTTYINTQTLNIGDNIITLNADETGTPSADAGIEVERGTSANKSLFWDESEDEWTVGSERFKAGTFEGNLTGNVTGNVTGAVTGNSTTATTLQTARTIALGGDLSGSASFNGSSNITITATVADDSHNHVISNVDGLQAALDGKATSAQGALADTAVQPSDILNALMPSGTVIQFAGSAAPSGYLKANGNAVSRTTYATLFAAIGTTYGTGDGSTTFNLPDLRGEFVRGLDDGRGVDAGRTLGSAQADEFEAHNHRALGETGGPIAGFGYQTATFMGAQMDGAAYTDSYGGLQHIEDTGGTETRPRNIALLYCIKT